MNATTYENYINPMEGKRFTLPDDVVFADLKCKIDDANHLAVDWKALDAACRFNSIDPDLVRTGGQRSLSTVVMTWYLTHLARGGCPDPVVDDFSRLYYRQYRDSHAHVLFQRAQA